MRFETFTALQAIIFRWPVEHGKIVQMLLGIAFDPQRAGFKVINRFSEGVDLELIRGTDKYAVEVKTTEGTHICLQRKDVAGLQAKYASDGYVPVVAALKLQRAADWVMANAQNLAPNDYTPERLALDSVHELQNVAGQHFEKALRDLKQSILNPPDGAPLEYLATVLASESR